MSDATKKDLTSIVDLAKLEPAPDSGSEELNASEPLAQEASFDAPLSETPIEEDVLEPKESFEESPSEPVGVSNDVFSNDAFSPDLNLSTTNENPSSDLLEQSSNEFPNLETLDSTSAHNIAPVLGSISALEQPPLDAPPAGKSLLKNSVDSTKNAQPSLDDVHKMAEKLPIGKPILQASPAFSVLIYSEKDIPFPKQALQFLEEFLNISDLGIRMEDLKLQISSGKILIPQISEFAAITLAQKIYPYVSQIELDLSDHIFKSESMSSVESSIAYLDTEKYDPPKEEIRDVAAEPKTEEELFTSNLHDHQGFQVVRILSTVHVSEIIDAAIAENETDPLFEKAVDRLTRELKAKGFSLGAHGVIGISFNLKSIEVFRDAAGNFSRAYRLFGTGTAVRIKKTS